MILETLGEQLIKSSLAGRIPEGLSHGEAWPMFLKVIDLINGTKNKVSFGIGLHFLTVMPDFETM